RITICRRTTRPKIQVPSVVDRSRRNRRIGVQPVTWGAQVVGKTGVVQRLRSDKGLTTIPGHQADGRRHVTAGAITPNAEALAVYSVISAMLGKRKEHRIAILHTAREGMLRGEPIVG